MIIFLYGEDEFCSGRKLAEIKNKFFEKNKEGGTLFVFDFAQAEEKVDEMLLKLSSGGLFSNKKLAVVKNILQNKVAAEDKNIFDFLKKISRGQEKDLILIFWEKGKIDQKMRLAKFLLEKAKKQEFEILKESKLASWINKEVKEVGRGIVTISPKAVEKLSVFVGSNSALLAKEIEKLVTYKSQGEISEEDVELLVKAKVDTDIFRTLDALGNGDKKKALELLHNHLERGDHPLFMLDRYFYQFRNLLKVKFLAEKNKSPSEIAIELKLHPFVVRKSLEQGRRFSLEKLRELYKKLCEIDFSTKTGKVDIELALDKFVAEV
jgi:DNA polymerase-3 subunit delta